MIEHERNEGMEVSTHKPAIDCAKNEPLIILVPLQHCDGPSAMRLAAGLVGLAMPIQPSHCGGGRNPAPQSVNSLKMPQLKRACCRFDSKLFNFHSGRLMGLEPATTGITILDSVERADQAVRALPPFSAQVRVHRICITLSITSMATASTANTKNPPE